MALGGVVVKSVADTVPAPVGRVISAAIIPLVLVEVEDKKNGKFKPKPNHNPNPRIRITAPGPARNRNSDELGLTTMAAVRW